MLTAQQIHEKNFEKGFKGYNMDEVDAFLDEVVDSFDRLSRENKELNSRIEALNTQIESYRGMENTMMHTMVTVHKAAEDITDSAKREAEELYTKTREQADEILARAKRESEQMILTARTNSQSIVDGYQEQIRQAQDDLLSIKSLLEEFKAGVHSYTAELLGFVDKIDAPKEVYDLEESLDASEQDESEEKKDYVDQYVNGLEEKAEQASEQPEEQPAEQEQPYYGPVDVDGDDADENFLVDSDAE